MSATRPYFSGKIRKIIQEMATFAENSLFVCAHCGSTNAELLPCSNCNAFKYCNRECQLAHWNAGHGQECRRCSSTDAVATSVGWPDFFTRSASDCAKSIHRLKWKNDSSGAIQQGSFALSQRYRESLQSSIANPSADWPPIQRDSNKNNRVELIGAIVQQLSMILEFFYLHALYRSGSEQRGVLLIEAETMFLEDLVNTDPTQHLQRPIAVHFFTQTEITQYFNEYCSIDGNDYGQTDTAKSMLNTCRLDDPRYKDTICVVAALRHHLDRDMSEYDGSWSQCHTTILLPNESTDDERRYMCALYCMNQIYEQSAEGMTDAQVLEIDLLSGNVVAFDLKPREQEMDEEEEEEWSDCDDDDDDGDNA